MIIFFNSFLSAEKYCLWSEIGPMIRWVWDLVEKSNQNLILTEFDAYNSVQSHVHYSSMELELLYLFSAERATFEEFVELVWSVSHPNGRMSTNRLTVDITLPKLCISNARDRIVGLSCFHLFRIHRVFILLLFDEHSWHYAEENWEFQSYLHIILVSLEWPIKL